MVNGDAFLTKPGKNIFSWQKKLLKKLQKLIQNFLQLGDFRCKIY